MERIPLLQLTRWDPGNYLDIPGVDMTDAAFQFREKKKLLPPSFIHYSSHRTCAVIEGWDWDISCGPSTRFPCPSSELANVSVTPEQPKAFVLCIRKVGLVYLGGAWSRRGKKSIGERVKRWTGLAHKYWASNNGASMLDSYQERESVGIADPSVRSTLHSSTPHPHPHASGPEAFSVNWDRSIQRWCALTIS